MYRQHIDSGPLMLTRIVNLALTYLNHGRWTEAKKMFIKVMEMNRKVLGEEHPER